MGRRCGEFASNMLLSLKVHIGKTPKQSLVENVSQFLISIAAKVRAIPATKVLNQPKVLTLKP
jgi:hypothetical protein